VGSSGLPDLLTLRQYWPLDEGANPCAFGSSEQTGINVVRLHAPTDNRKAIVPPIPLGLCGS
jgi:hypothetical protein